jgi:hypothetical protein
MAPTELHEMKQKQLLTLYKFYDIETNDMKVKDMRAVFARFLNLKHFPYKGRNFDNLMKELTRECILQGMTLEEKKKEIDRMGVLCTKARLDIFGGECFERF